jgi:hypothetical protein
MDISREKSPNWVELTVRVGGKPFENFFLDPDRKAKDHVSFPISSVSLVCCSICPVSTK